MRRRNRIIVASRVLHTATVRYILPIMRQLTMHWAAIRLRRKTPNRYTSWCGHLEFLDGGKFGERYDRKERGAGHSAPRGAACKGRGRGGRVVHAAVSLRSGISGC